MAVVISTGDAFRAVEHAIREPGDFCARLTSFPTGTRQMEPVERWQTRAVLSALSRLEGHSTAFHRADEQEGESPA